MFRKEKESSPGAMGVRAQGFGTLHFLAVLDGIGTQLDPVVYEEGDIVKGHYNGEEGEVSELQDHLANVSGHIVNFEINFFADTCEESGILWRIFCRKGGSSSTVLRSALGLKFLVLGGALAFEVRHDELQSEIHNLRGYCEVYDLLAEAIRVDGPVGARTLKLLFVFRKRPDSNAEDVEVGYYDVTERNVDERRKKDGQVRRNEVEDEDLLRQSVFVCSMRLVVFEFSELSRHLGQDT